MVNSCIKEQNNIRDNTKETSRTFQGLAQKFKEFSRKNNIQGLFKDSP